MLTKKATAISTGALALAMMTAGSPAMAANPKFDPAPNTFKLEGVLTLSQTTTIRCDVEIHVSVDAAGAATVTGRTFSATSSGTSPLCGTIVQPFGNWTLAPNSTTQVTATVGSSSIAGQCVGPITGAWTNGNTSTIPSEVTFSSASVPGTPGPCTVSGTLKADDVSVQIIH